MVEIGGQPLLWHIMKIYSAHGINDFVICLGYKGIQIKEFFFNYRLHDADLTVDIAKGEAPFHRSHAEPWRVTLVDTGEATQTGGRLKRVMPHVGDEPVFALPYGAGLGAIALTADLASHEAHGRQAAVTAVQPVTRFGALSLDGDTVVDF